MVQFLFLRRVDYDSLFFPCSCRYFKALNMVVKSLRRRKLLALSPALLRLHRDFVCILTKTKKSRYPNNIRSHSYHLNPNIFPITSKHSNPNKISTFQNTVLQISCVQTQYLLQEIFDFLLERILCIVWFFPEFLRNTFFHNPKLHCF